MAKLPPKKAEENTGEWLNTYADMVTLLLTFFVLLFSCSNMDETKIQYIVQAFQVRGHFLNTVVSKPNPDETTTDTSGNSNVSTEQGGEGENVKSFDELHQYLSEYIDDKELGENVSVENGKYYFTIRFNSNVLFEPDSYILKPEGRRLINDFSPAIHAVERSIKTLMVTGHTAYVARYSIDPWYLSSMRAVSVESLLNLNNTVDDSKYQIIGYGPNRPLGDDTTADGKRQNRRVEIVILKNTEDFDLNDPEVLKDLLLHQFNITSNQYDPNGDEKPDPGILPDGAVDKIIANINDSFSDAGVSGGVYGPGFIDDKEFIIEEEGKDKTSE